MRYHARYIALWAFISAGAISAFAAGGDSSPAPNVVPAYLLNFTKLVSWPSPPTGAFPMCIQGDAATGKILSDRATASGHTLSVLQDVPDGQIASCRLLFIGKDEKEETPVILAAAKHHPVLTVSEQPGFIQAGGMIEIGEKKTQVGDSTATKYTIRINAKAVEQESLTISPMLLQLSDTPDSPANK